MADGLPPDIERFLDRYVPSLGHLEALLLVRNLAPRPIAAADVARRLYIMPDVAAAQLAELQGFGLLTPAESAERGFQYVPPDADLDRLIDETARLYQQRRVTVITYIYSKPVNKVRTFADSFRLRKPPDEKGSP
jgi:hypothetical protein